jgi:hypothetical protein
MYEFDEQLADGENHEKTLDSFYSQSYKVTKVSMEEQKRGLDRVFTSSDGFRFSVEYKADTTADTSNKAFVETVSVNTSNKPGWAYSSCSQILIYYIPPRNIAYRFETMKIKRLVNKWKEIYETKEAPNNGYTTLGVVVPLGEFIKHAYKVEFIRGI